MPGLQVSVTYFSLPIQRFFLILQAVQFAYISLSYFSSTFNNKFPVLEALFKPEFASLCTRSGCWQSIVPFPGSLYSAIFMLCIFTLFFRPGRELRLVILFMALIQIFMATVRLFIVPQQFYPEGVALQASLLQFSIGAVLVVVCLLPYPQLKVGREDAG